MKGSGGTEGGLGMFVVGFILAVLGLYFFFDSVRVRSDMGGLISGAFGGRGLGQTTSMGILFVPFLISVIALFQDATRRWGWVLLYVGLAVLVIEVLSRIHFFIDGKLTHLLGMMLLFGAGVGLMLRSYREATASRPPNREATASRPPKRESTASPPPKDDHGSRA